MDDTLVTGQVLSGINNIYSVSAGDQLYQCRIKGKVLKSGKNTYNPIAVGDFVSLQPDPISADVGWIVERQERKSTLSRWNKKRRAVQVLAANAELAVCVSSVQAPPFRPRFIDRMIVSAEAGDLQPVIALNKCDLGLDQETEGRIKAYRGIGYQVVECSALSGRGIEKLKAVLAGRLAVFAGQSGVGKSSILNRIDPALDLSVGDVSSKYDRGVHTTSCAKMFRLDQRVLVIDTPGVREFEVAEIRPEELWHFFREFSEHASHCLYPACRHMNEPECAVRKAAEGGSIHYDRYESYLRIFEDLTEFYREFHGSPHA